MTILIYIPDFTSIKVKPTFPISTLIRCIDNLHQKDQILFGLYYGGYTILNVYNVDNFHYINKLNVEN
jgi:hypothetical protein